MNSQVSHGLFCERRKYPRFKPISKIYVLHSIFGNVTDISIAGLSYTYYSWKGDIAESAPAQGTIFSVDETYLDNFPFSVIGDEIIQSSSPILSQIKKRRICFHGLTEKQLVMLESFLLTYVDVPMVGGVKQQTYRQSGSVRNFSSL